MWITIQSYSVSPAEGNTADTKITTCILPQQSIDTITSPREGANTVFPRDADTLEIVTNPVNPANTPRDPVG